MTAPALTTLEAEAPCLTRDCPTPPDGHTHGRAGRACLRCPACCRAGGGTGVTTEYGECLICGLEIVGGQTPPHCLECDKHHPGGHIQRQKCAFCHRTIYPGQEAIRSRPAAEVVHGDANAYHLRGGKTKAALAHDGNCFAAFRTANPPVDDGPLIRGGLLRRGR